MPSAFALGIFSGILFVKLKPPENLRIFRWLFFTDGQNGDILLSQQDPGSFTFRGLACFLCGCKLRQLGAACFGQIGTQQKPLHPHHIADRFVRRLAADRHPLLPAHMTEHDQVDHIPQGLPLQLRPEQLLLPELDQKRFQIFLQAENAVRVLLLLPGQILFASF